MSLPGLTLTRNRPYTGRWSDVLMPGQEEYFTGQMSSLWRLLNRTRSCGRARGPVGGGRGRPALPSLPSSRVPSHGSPRGPAPAPQPRRQAAHRVGWGPLLGGAVIRVLPDVELVRRQEVDVRLLEALEDGPWEGAWPRLGGGSGPAPPRPLGPPAAAAPGLLTSLHLTGELVMLQQGLHAGARVLPQDGLHGRPPPAQAEVEVSEPEDLVEAGGDVRWGMRGREVCETRPPLPVCLHPDSGSGYSRTPPEAGGSPGPPWGSGPGRRRGGGVPASFWVHGVTTRGAWRQTLLQVGERLQTFLALVLKALTIPLH